jgi:hypothetical protein
MRFNLQFRTAPNRFIDLAEGRPQQRGLAPAVLREAEEPREPPLIPSHFHWLLRDMGLCGLIRSITEIH